MKNILINKILMINLTPMTPQPNTAEQNRMIAIFDGWTFVDHEIASKGKYSYKSFERYGEAGDIINQFTGGDCWNVETDGDIPYHVDWNWLMPIVSKIESMGVDVTIVKNICIMYGFYEYAPNSTRIFSCRKDSDTKLCAPYQAVCAFIKQFNEKEK